MKALEREWRARLKASGFVDLEGDDRDGPLSDRGNLHAVDHSDEQLGRLVQRIEDGGEVTARAAAILHAKHANGSRRLRFVRTALERQVWQQHAEGSAELTIGRNVGITRHRVRQVLQTVEARVTQGREGKKRWRNQKRQEKQRVSSLVRRADPATLMQLAVVLLSTRTQRAISR